MNSTALPIVRLQPCILTQNTRWEVNEDDTNNQLLSLVYSNQNLPKEKLCATYEVFVISQKGLMLFQRIFNWDQKPTKFEKDQEKR